MDILCHWGVRVCFRDCQNSRRVNLAVNCTGDQQDAAQEETQDVWLPDHRQEKRHSTEVHYL